MGFQPGGMPGRLRMSFMRSPLSPENLAVAWPGDWRGGQWRAGGVRPAFQGDARRAPIAPEIGDCAPADSPFGPEWSGCGVVRLGFKHGFVGLGETHHGPRGAKAGGVRACGPESWRFSWIPLEVAKKRRRGGDPAARALRGGPWCSWWRQRPRNAGAGKISRRSPRTWNAIGWPWTSFRAMHARCSPAK